MCKPTSSAIMKYLQGSNNLNQVSLYFFIKYLLYLNFKCFTLSSSSPPETSYPIPPPPASKRVLPTHLPTPAFLSWHSPTLGHRTLQAQELFLPVMSKAILCHIWGLSHGSLHVFSSMGGPVPGSSRGSGCFILLLLPPPTPVGL